MGVVCSRRSVEFGSQKSNQHTLTPIMFAPVLWVPCLALAAGCSMISPVSQPASDEARKMATSAMSLGWASLRRRSDADAMTLHS
jgi:hypothetical protein